MSEDRDVWERSTIAERLECGCLSTAFRLEE